MSEKFDILTDSTVRLENGVSMRLSQVPMSGGRLRLAHEIPRCLSTIKHGFANVSMIKSRTVRNSNPKSGKFCSASVDIDILETLISVS